MPTNEQLRELRAVMRRLRWMPLGGQLKEVRTVMRKLQRMPIGGQFREVHATMRKLRRMLTGGQLRKVRAAMRILLWKLLHVLTFEHFCILISNRKHIMRIVKLTRASESNCQKSVAKKFETLIVKHVVPNVS
jgi:hypothetical protein